MNRAFLADQPREMTDVAAQRTWFQKYRRDLGVAAEYDRLFVMLVSGHRGLVDAKYPEHLAMIEELPKNGMAGYGCFPLTDKNNPSRLCKAIEALAARTFASELKSSAPGYVINVVLLPPLDENGESARSNHVCSLNRETYGTMLGEIRQFLGVPSERVLTVTRSIRPQRILSNG